MLEHLSSIPEFLDSLMSQRRYEIFDGERLILGLKLAIVNILPRKLYLGFARFREVNDFALCIIYQKEENVVQRGLISTDPSLNLYI
jgi:hypothetical protein